MIGKRFHMLTVVREVDRIYYKTTSTKAYLCRCDCGNEITALPSNLRRGATKSCGCWKAKTAGNASKTHGMSKTPEYRIWTGITKRCTNPKHKDFHLWGGKGIKVCERWSRDFANFYADMGPKPSPAHQIDRINSDLNYSPDNCRWATPLEQSLNTTKVKKIVFLGETMSVRQFAKRISRSYFTIYDWIVRRGHSVEEVLDLISSKRTNLNPRTRAT